MAEQIAAQWDRLAAESRAALLRSERSALVSLRKAVDTATQPALVKLARIRTADRRAATEASVAALRSVKQRLGDALEASLLGVRLTAKKAATARLEDEWTTLRRDVRALGLADPGPLGRTARLEPTDRAAVESTSSAYVAAWTSSTSSALWDWTSDDGNDAAPSEVVEQATRGLDYRVRRIATTENAQAYADARDEATDAVARERNGATWIPGLLKRWDSTLDKRVCAVCRALDSTLRPWGMTFPKKREPGHVHPGCRCDSHTVFIPLRIPDLDLEREAA